MSFCPVCGKRVAPESAFCRHCGAELQSDPSARGSTDTSTAEEQTETAGAGAASDASEDGEPADEPLHERERGVDFAVYYPQLDGWRAPVISGFLLVGSVVVVPLIPFLGYCLRVGRAAARGDPSPPEYEDWAGLFRDGLRFLVVLVASAVALVLVAGLGAVGAESLGSFRLRELVRVASFLAGYYLFLAVVVAYVGSDGVLEIVADGRVGHLLSSTFFLTAYLWSIVLFVAVYLGAALLMFVLPWSAAYAMVATVAYWGYVYYRATQLGIVPASTRDRVESRGRSTTGENA